MEMPDFKRVIRGYEPEAVDQAWAETDRQLSEANAANKELRLQINNLREQNTEWGNRLKSYETMESDLRDALLSAQRAANQIREEANQKAETLSKSARDESDAIIAEANRLAEERKTEIEADLIEKKQEIFKLQEEIQVLIIKRDKLRNLVEKSLQHFEIIQNLLGDPSKIQTLLQQEKGS
ncbi:chromosome partition protein Smc [Desulfosporosinus acididurans]|uniref:Chromosome partition protein Smc n=2 Tax=Desulfosporosinus acididurans TaxID=476652 RepID=A0A0J1FXP3_9FIRM|nr:chromosome partition protein Smc [Desulfosporosinus acididurans]